MTISPGYSTVTAACWIVSNCVREGDRYLLSTLLYAFIALNVVCVVLEGVQAVVDNPDVKVGSLTPVMAGLGT